MLSQIAIALGLKVEPKVKIREPSRVAIEFLIEENTLLKEQNNALGSQIRKMYFRAKFDELKCEERMQK